jgi:hypothetical protein
LGERGEKSFILSETEGRGAGLESVEPLSR